jgi:hypothetical protein
MQSDKQLRGVKIGDVLRKRELDQALNTKEFAVLTGISYSTAREWFRLPGFPVLHGVVFWGDFVQWRQTKTGLTELKATISPNENSEDNNSGSKTNIKLSARASRILSEAN